MSLLALALAILTPERPATPSDVTHRMVCRGPEGSVAGTGFYVGPNTLLTAAHVASGRECSIAGVGVETVYVDGYSDIAAVRTPVTVTSWAPISCGRIKRNAVVDAHGFPGTLAPVRRIFLDLGKIVSLADRNFHGLAKFGGQASPGMSGSAITHKGKVVGILTAGNNTETFARMLSTTDLCR